MPFYSKLTRDLLSKVIEKTEKFFNSRFIWSRIHHRIKKKLGQEPIEYNEAKTDDKALEELVDFLEVIRTATKTYSSSFQQLKEIFKLKAKKNNGFEK